METVLASGEQVAQAAGAAWVWSLAFSFVAVALETSRPKSEGGEHSRVRPLNFLLGVINLATPALLVWHGFRVARVATVNPLLAIAPILLAAFLGGAVIGSAIALAAPALGRWITRAAPMFGILAFLLAVYVALPDLFPHAIHDLVEGIIPA